MIHYQDGKWVDELAPALDAAAVASETLGIVVPLEAALALAAKNYEFSAEREEYTLSLEQQLIDLRRELAYQHRTLTAAWDRARAERDEALGKKP